MKTLLSTKILSLAQKELLLNSGIGVVEYNAISIDFIDFNVKSVIENAIFTSQNAVRAIKRADVQIKRSFCVGEKTKRLLEENGQKVAIMTKNASKLAEMISKEYKKETFLFFSGNKRREELPLFLKENNIPLEEVQVYQTTLQPRKIVRSFNGVLFFSPSAVDSYLAHNSLHPAPAFCIGETTAKTAKKNTDTVIIANKPTIENTIIQAIKYLRTI